MNSSIQFCYYARVARAMAHHVARPPSQAVSRIPLNAIEEFGVFDPGCLDDSRSNDGIVPSLVSCLIEAKLASCLTKAKRICTINKYLIISYSQMLRHI